MGNGAYPASRLDGVDLLRGVAALGVVLAHAVDTAEGGAAATGLFLPLIPAANDFGASGVDLFFVISGFVMAHAIARADGAPTAAAFFRRRVQRIMPLFLIASLFYTVLLVAGGFVPAISGLLNTVTLVPLFDMGAYSVPPLFVGWTLAFEAAFYLLVMAVLATGVKPRRTMVLALTIAAAGAGMVIHPDWMAARILFNPIMAEFALGVGAHLLWQRGWSGSRALRLLIGLLLAFLGVLAVHPVDIGFTVHFASVVSGDSGLLRAIVWGVPLTLILLGTLDLKRSGGPVRHCLSEIGKASYSLYLVHPFVMLVAQRAGVTGRTADVYLLVAALVALSILLGLVIHRGIERPLLAWLQGPRALVPVAIPAPAPAPAEAALQMNG